MEISCNPVDGFASRYKSSSTVRKALVAKETESCIRTPEHVRTDDFDAKPCR